MLTCTSLSPLTNAFSTQPSKLVQNSTYSNLRPQKLLLSGSGIPRLLTHPFYLYCPNLISYHRKRASIAHTTVTNLLHFTTPFIPYKSKAS